MCWMRARMGMGFAAAMVGIAAVAGGPSAAIAENRIFTIAAVELKGGTRADKEPFPAEPLPAGRGYELKEPNQTGRWEVSAMVWQPSQIIVNEGDEVTLEFIGIDSASHATTISGYSHSFTLKRGHMNRVSFVADKPGVFLIACATHMPSMRAELVVMARQSR
jgi:plastocyanin